VPLALRRAECCKIPSRSATSCDRRLGGWVWIVRGRELQRIVFEWLMSSSRQKNRSLCSGHNTFYEASSARKGTLGANIRANFPGDSNVYHMPWLRPCCTSFFSFSASNCIDHAREACYFDASDVLGATPGAVITSASASVV
jgi:hypothetical protein